ncbi:MAG: type IV secretory system conjugative DNA transfer family protein [Pseudomonadota bacterium]
MIAETISVDIFIAAALAAFIILLALKVGLYAPPSARADAKGSARWARLSDLKRAGLLGASGLILGRHNKANGGMLRLPTDTHFLTVAPTRSGKGVSAIIPNLLSWQGSVLVIDPKGENAAVTSSYRATLEQDVQIL